MKLFDVNITPGAAVATAFSCINTAPAEGSLVLLPLGQAKRTPAPLPRSQVLVRSPVSQGGSWSRHNGARNFCSPPVPLENPCQGWTRSSEASLRNPVLRSHPDQAGTMHPLCIQPLLKLSWSKKCQFYKPKKPKSFKYMLLTIYSFKI